MTEVVTLDSKEIRTIIAKFLQLEEKQVIPTRYSYNISGMSAQEILSKINGYGDSNEA